MSARIWLGLPGEEKLLPAENRTFREREVEDTREAHTASGKLIIDVVTVKKVFTLTYETITGSDLEVLNEIINLSAFLSLLIEREDGAIDTYTVKARPFSRTRYLASGLSWLWSDLSITLEEQ